MSATAFVHNLFDAGRVRVTAWDELPSDLDEAVRLLDDSIRPDLPYQPPGLRLAPAVWALRTVYRASQALTFREIDEDAVRAMLANPCPEPAGPPVCYSVDLSFRLLPDLISLARGLAWDDPLVTSLLSLAAAWPLSSVGVKGLPAADPGAFINDQALRRVYADRIIERADVSRLQHPGARQAVREALGAFVDLAPTAIVEALQGTAAPPAQDIQHGTADRK